MTYSHPGGRVFYRKMGHGRPMMAHGHGVYLYDKAGKRYLDASGGPLVTNVGHGRSEIVQAIAQQAQALAYAHATMFTSEAVEEYAAHLAKVMPMPDVRIFFLSSGSEVVEGALKLARQIQMARGESERQLIISRSQSYHGTTLGALSVSGRPHLRSPYLSMIRDVPHVQPPYPYRYDASGPALAERLEKTILTYGPQNVAAFIAEPISGAGLGAVVPPDDYWPAIRQTCNRHGLLLIVDEILTGMGRTGRWWGIQHWPVEPDILVTSKGIAGGYFPLGALVARNADVTQIAQTLGDFNHGGTFSHHPVGAAAGLATLRIIHEEGLVENAARMGQQLGRQLHEALGDRPHVGDVRGRGLFWALEFVRDRNTKEPFPAGEQLAWRIWEEAFKRGLIVYHSQGCADGQDGDLILLGPPLIINEQQIEELVWKLEEAVDAALKK